MWIQELFDLAYNLIRNSNEVVKVNTMCKFITQVFFVLCFTVGNAHAALVEFGDIFPSLLEAQSALNTADMTVDSSMLTLKHDHNVSVFFISEGAGYKNSFGWYDASTNPTNVDNRIMLWENASGTGEGLQGGGSLNTGDSITLGNLSAGTTLGFFITANGFFTGSNGTHFFTDEIYNPDDIQHVIAGVYPEFGIVALGFEDIYGGGDKDYNDLLVAIDFGVPNTRQLLSAITAVPAPNALLLFLSSLVLLLITRYRHSTHSRAK